jgi:hypothetical protein
MFLGHPIYEEFKNLIGEEATKKIANRFNKGSLYFPAPRETSPAPESGDESFHTKFSGYTGVIPENMAVPVTLFLSEQEAIQYASEQYGEKFKIKKYPASSAFCKALRQC